MLNKHWLVDNFRTSAFTFLVTRIFPSCQADLKVEEKPMRWGGEGRREKEPSRGGLIWRREGWKGLLMTNIIKSV